MSYQPFTVSAFRGLDLRSDPEDVGADACIAGVNFDVDRPQRVRSRDGSTRLGSSGVTGATSGLVIPTSFAGVPALLTASYSSPSGTTYLDRFDSAGARTVIGNFGSNYVTDYARFGSPTAERVYVASVIDGALAFPATSMLLQRYNGSTLTTVSGRPAYVAVMPGENRLVQGHFTDPTYSPSGANGSRSTVYFSNAGDPETYSTNNYVHLQPGDGEYLVALDSWRELLFAFKQSTLFVFYGSSTDATGNPIFNYRTVSLPAAMELTSAIRHPVAVGTNGVYFFAGNAIYRTAGGEPQIVSNPVAPILERITDSTLNYGGDEIRLSWANERLYVRYMPEQGSNPLVLVFDEKTGEWMLWQFGDDTNTGQRLNGNVAAWQGRPYYLNAAGHIMFIDPDATDDDSAAFASAYQSGFYDAGDPEVKTVRQTLLWGSGAPTVSVFTDHGTVDADAAAVTLGTAPAVDEGYHRVAKTGVFFSHKFSSSSGAWAVNRVEHHVRERRVAGAR